jgi:hypothetical protein
MGILFNQRSRQLCFALLIGIIKEADGQVKDPHKFIDPFSINIVGNFRQIHAIHFDWSIGEAAMANTHTAPNNLVLSTGFLQSIYYPLHLYQQIDSFDIQIKVGPNPFTNRIIIQSRVDEMIVKEIKLIDFQGNLLYLTNISYSGLQLYHEILIGKLLYPVCFLSIRYCIGDAIYKSKYFKLIQK